MLDAFKKSGSRQQSDELQTLIAASKEERAALSTMLTQVQLHGAKLVAAGKTLQEVEEKASKAQTRLDELQDRLSKADARTKELEAVETRIRGVDRGRRSGREGGGPADRARRRAAEAQAGAPEPVIAGAPDAREPRHAQEGPGIARRAPRAPPAGPVGDQGIERENRGFERGVRPAAVGVGPALAGLLEAQGPVARDARRNERHRRDGKGRREAARVRSPSSRR